VVDRLLAATPGERWGRHWLDVARYVESSGKDVNISFPHAWRYRDYVIAAFNADKPYDELREQLAGDYPQPMTASAGATGRDGVFAIDRSPERTKSATVPPTCRRADRFDVPACSTDHRLRALS
jgi:hypothetical protein